MDTKETFGAELAKQIPIVERIRQEILLCLHRVSHCASFHGNNLATKNQIASGFWMRNIS